MKIFTSHFICKGSKRLCGVLLWEGAGDRTETAIFWPSLLWPSHCVFLVLLMHHRRSSGHSAGWWLSLRHLISIFSGPQLIWAQRPLWPDVAFLTTFRLQLSGIQLAWLLSWLSYIIVQRPRDRPCDRPRDLWNRMFNRHQAEITVMQFRGPSLPVHQSMRVSWNFFYFVPFHQPISANAISSHNCH